MNSVDIAYAITIFVQHRDVIRHANIVAHVKSLGVKRTQKVIPPTMFALGFERVPPQPRVGVLYRRPSRPIAEWRAVLDALVRGRDTVSFEDVERALISARYLVGRRMSSREKAGVREMMSVLGFARREVVVGRTFRRIIFVRERAAGKAA